MQPSSSHSPGEVVRVRGRLWQIQAARVFDGCEALHLEELAGSGPSRRLTLLTPFDRPQPAGRTSSFRVTSRRSWVRHLAALLARSRPADALLAPPEARADLLPYQLEPVVAMALDGHPRLLIADAVGLGKTIQAGFVVLELRLRNLASHVLVLTPAGLRQQWAHELRRRFRLPAAVIDAPALAVLRQTLPRSVNPWSVEPVVITSLDFVKRPDVERGALDVPWDLVVVDEAHLATESTARRAVVQRLASQSPYVVLLTATPHAGDDAAFKALCQIGDVPPEQRGTASARAPQDGSPLVVFRRTRRDVGLPCDRRVHLHQVTQNAVEQRAFASLLSLARTVWNERTGCGRAEARLAMTVLLKRGLSSPASLARSLEHRLAVLEGRPPVDTAQLDLFGQDDDEPRDGCSPSSVAAPGLLEPAREVEWLRRIAADARAAAASPSKIAALQRVLERVREPAIVFTEYRDTLGDVADRLRALTTCAVLHGGLDGPARSEALRQFTRGRARVLVATDAAGEGLNLQARCRLVLNLELPWNPVRLEQRIGRVDRLGQTRRVHAVHFVARDTLESRVLARLGARLERIRRTLGDVDDVLGGSAEARIAEACVADSAVEGIWGVRAPRPADAVLQIAQPATVGARARAADECRRAEDRRRLLACRARRRSRHRASHGRERECPVVWVDKGRLRRFALRLGGPAMGRLIVIFEAWIVDDGGQFVESMLVPVALDGGLAGQTPRRSTLTAIQRRLEAAGASLRAAARNAAGQRAAHLTTVLGPAVSQRRRRLAAIAWSHAAGEPVQPGLFDQRALREARRRIARSLTRTVSLDTSVVLPGAVLDGVPSRRSSGAPAGPEFRTPDTGGAYRLAGDPVPVAVLAQLTDEERACWRA